MVTATQVRLAATESHVVWVEHHRCSICTWPVGYQIDVMQRLSFQDSCHCTPWHPPEPRNWQDIADWINNTRDANAKAELMKTWGFEDA